MFPASRGLSEAEVTQLLEAVDEFLAGWAAHGAPLMCGRELVDGQFLVVGVDEDVEAPSGGSIDALTNRLRSLGDRMGVKLIEHGSVWFRAADGVRAVSRREFRELAAVGTVTPATRVFDTAITSVARLRQGQLERPAADTWHGRAFFD